MKPVIYRHAAGWQVEFTSEVVERWQLAVRDPDEAGGVLLGNRFDECHDLLIDVITEPQPGDRRTPGRFYRGVPGHQGLVDRAWAESEGQRVYLGEWHSHTAGGPSPSIIDKLTWAKFVREASQLPLVFVVVTPGGTAVWGTAVKGELQPLALSQPSDDSGP